MKALLLAAGRGTRLGELTEHTPKPMVKVGGRHVLEHNLRWLGSHGIRDVAINTHHLGDVIEDRFGDGSQLDLSICYSRETELLGTAGALKPVHDFLSDGPFMVVHADNLFDFDLRKLFDAHAGSAAVATLALYSLDTHQHTGEAGSRVEMDRSGRILRFVDDAVDPGLRMVDAGCYVMEPSLLQHIPDGEPFDFERDLFPMILSHQGILCGHVIDGSCLVVDTPEALAAAQRLHDGKVADERG